MDSTLILFDIDGTLLVTGGASSRCIRRVAGRVLGRAVDEVKITVGTLDHEIFAELARGCGAQVSHEMAQAYRRAYARELKQELALRAGDVKALAGGRELVARLGNTPGVCIGILSGNWREIGEMKLRAAGYSLVDFRVMAFADDGAVRPDLVKAAMRQASKLGCEIHDARQIILVGDTPRDIRCARAAGCRVVSVATGMYSKDELSRHLPDGIMANLLDTAPLMELIAGQSSADPGEVS